MIPNAPWHKAWLAAALLAAATCPVHLREAEPYKAHSAPHGSHHARSDETAGEEGHHHLYYRPFCRRSHYVTNPSAPCWQ